MSVAFDDAGGLVAVVCDDIESRTFLAGTGNENLDVIGVNTLAIVVPWVSYAGHVRVSVLSMIGI